MIKGVITDIQRFSVHDGPGIRTTVFFKGCSNRCAWCHNPETLSVAPQLQFFSERCANCGRCVSACPKGCHQMENEKHAIDRNLCVDCGHCTESCYSGALILSGREVTVEEVMEQLIMDEPYYRNSNGGVTLSGGEPVLQWKFALEILKQCKARGLHTALQTAGNYGFECLDELLPYLDLVMYDIKAFREEIYNLYIVGNRTRILENLKNLDRKEISIMVRTPVIGGVNDTVQEIEAVAGFISDLSHLVHYVLIPYHGMGKAKYEALDMAYQNTFYTPDAERMQQLERLAAEHVKVFNKEIGYIH